MRPPRRSESGAALLLTVLVLAFLSLIGLAALGTVTRDQQVAGFQNRRKAAFYAAEAGVAKAMETLTTNQNPSIPTTDIGDSTIYPYGLPSFQADPTVTDPVEILGTAAFPGMSLNLGQGGAPTYQIGYWKIRVQGNAPGGSVAHLEVVSGSLVSN